MSYSHGPSSLNSRRRGDDDISMISSSPSTLATPPAAAASSSSSSYSSSKVVEFDPKAHWCHADANSYTIPFGQQLQYECQKRQDEINTISSSDGGSGIFFPLNQPPSTASNAFSTPVAIELKKKQCALLSHWLMLACTQQLDTLSIEAAHNQLGAEASAASSQPLQVTSHLHTISTLIEMGARVDARDSEGWTCVHWLIFAAMWKPPGKAHIIKSESGETADNELDLSHVTRYQVEVEATLSLLLNASTKQGYIYECGMQTDIGADQEGMTGEDTDDTASFSSITSRPPQRRSILDLGDASDSSALRHAVMHRRVDLVGLLLCYGASIQGDNKSGISVWSMVSTSKESKPKASVPSSATSVAAVASLASSATSSSQRSKSTSDRKSQQHHNVSSASSGSEDDEDQSERRQSQQVRLNRNDASVYSSDDLTARKWGTKQHLKFESCQYEDEADEDAIMRLLLQQKLFEAVDADPNGNLQMVKKIGWFCRNLRKSMLKSGQELKPFVFRGDSFALSPLTIACSYETLDTQILEEMLKQPFLMHIQPRGAEYLPLTKAVMVDNMPAVDIFLKNGYNINSKDASTNQTALFTLVNQDAPIAIEDEEESEIVDKMAKFDADMLRLADELCKRGASPLSTDTNMNSTLTICVYYSRLPILKVLLAKLAPPQITDWLKSKNRFSNSVMHYCLYRQLPYSESDVELLEYMIEIGGSVDQPTNDIGLLPVQVWTGAYSPYAERMASAMKKNLTEVRQLLQARYRKLSGHVVRFDRDISKGLEKTAIPMISSYETSSSDRPKYFIYITELRPTDDITKEFIDTQKTSKRTKEEESIQEFVYRFNHNRSDRVPLSSFEVRMTEACGWGVFTRVSIPEDGIVFEVVGELLTLYEYEKRQVNYLRETELYLLPHYKVYDRLRPYAIDVRSYGNISRFVNHSCTPNLKLWNTDNGRTLVMYATKPIAPNQELTIDYNFEKMPRATVRCECGAKKCNGQIL